MTATPAPRRTKVHVNGQTRIVVLCGCGRLHTLDPLVRERPPLVCSCGARLVIEKGAGR